MQSNKVSVHFRVSYMTAWGQSVRVVGAHACLGNWDALQAPALSCRHAGDDLLWVGSVTIPKLPEILYKFAVVSEAGSVDAIEPDPRRLQLPNKLADGAVVLTYDDWQGKPHPSSLLRTSAFADVILQVPTREVSEHSEALEAQEGTSIVRLAVRGWKLSAGQRLAVTGNLPVLGSWQPGHCLSLTEVDSPVWMTEVRVPYAAFPITYKYAITCDDGSFDLEAGEARLVSSALPNPQGPQPGAHVTPDLIAADDGYFRHTSMPRYAAVATPVFSLRTHRSIGSGEFIDIKALVDICSAAGMRMVQLLPVNDTSVYNMWWDSYPYSSVSVFALHPLYLSLDKLTDAMPPELQAQIQKARRDLDLKDVDYEGTMAAKLSIARALFDQQGHKDLKTKDFNAWYVASKHWVQPYAAFCVLRDIFGTAEHWRWGSFSQGTPQVVDKVASPGQEHHAKLQFTIWLQYHLHLQLLSVSDYAESKRVALKGDLPIGVDKRSVDCWCNPSQFRMTVSTGAPPDYFDANGQNWGFPTYNWEEMAKDGYAWWRSRLHCLSQYFHAYRIDHILGFFRIWEIPGDCTVGLLGHFRPSIPLSRSELEARGIWDFDRLCQPFITPAFINETFGPLASEALARYLMPGDYGRFHLRPEYSSEKLIQGITARQGSPDWLVAETEIIKRGLMDLRHNVVLMRDEAAGDGFFPRFNLKNTHSWRELDPSWQGTLAALHDDYFFCRQEALWRSHALKTLPVLQAATDMLVCGEDLGMIPSCVPPAMAELGLVGLRIQRMPSEPDREFGDPSTYPYMVVASPSCHDTSTTRAWYEEDSERQQRFFAQGLAQSGTAPDTCTPDILRLVLRSHLESPAMWAIFPLQDIMPLCKAVPFRPAKEETINDPTNSKHYWRYRMHVPLEILLKDTDFVSELKSLIIDSGRVDKTSRSIPQNGHVPAAKLKSLVI